MGWIVIAFLCSLPLFADQCKNCEFKFTVTDSTVVVEVISPKPLPKSLHVSSILVWGKGLPPPHSGRNINFLTKGQAHLTCPIGLTRTHDITEFAAPVIGKNNILTPIQKIKWVGCHPTLLIPKEKSR